MDVVICKGVSGAGKSAFADILSQRIGWVSVCADDFFVNKDGIYNFDIDKLGAAHQDCQKRFLEALREKNIDGIVVANTNTSEREWRFYEQEALKLGARVFHIVLENRHGHKDVHGVPEETLAKQEQRLKNSIKLR